MMEAGVRVFKIEGRARGPEYVATVVGCYQEAIQSVLDGTFTEEKKRRMGRAVGPRVQPWFLGRVLPGTDFRRMDDELRLGRHGKKGLRGKAIKYFSKLGVGEFQIEAADMSVGDRLLVTGPNDRGIVHGFGRSALRLKPVETVGKGMRVSFKVPEKIRPNDKLYKLVKSAKEA